MENKVKTPLKCPGRSEGDGMENTSYPEHETIHTFRSPLSYYHKNFVPSQGKVKEPKFVPYEPYRAAVAPITSPPKKIDFFIDSHKVNSLASTVIKQFADSDGKTFGGNCMTDCSSKISALEEKIATLEKEKKELSSQFQIQAEVNRDLKKLLVASLGEDVQEKVQFMTQDKAQLGMEVLRLCTELQRADEEAQLLSVRSDVFEGKFKACSVLVRDLAEQKAALSLSLGRSIEIIKTILAEHTVLFEALSSAHSNLQVISGACNPGSKIASPANNSRMDLLGLGRQLKSLSNDLKERFLGKPLQSNPQFNCIRQFMGTERDAHQLLQALDEMSGNHNLSECSPGLVACQVLPHTCNRNGIPEHCCKHCSGEILNL
ncbi:golgin-45-like [Argiope bruennichi]|uniref:golgin-45-like n=1 Tax=Argiope bruennichi TaxID=94029 RepID=UPI00249561F5|nr:golgin-45-like [Argiope bruennichi]